MGATLAKLGIQIYSDACGHDGCDGGCPQAWGPGDSNDGPAWGGKARVSREWCLERVRAVSSA